MNKNTMRDAFEEKFGERGGFLYRSAVENWPFSNDQIVRLFEDAETMDDFIHAILGDEELMLKSQFYGELSRLMRWDPYVANSVVAMTVNADAGCVKLGNIEGTSAFLCSNGYGDGTFCLFVCRPDQFNRDCFNLVGSFEGKVKVYKYDCDPLSPAGEDDIVIEGSHFVYSFNGTTVICPTR